MPTAVKPPATTNAPHAIFLKNTQFSLSARNASALLLRGVDLNAFNFLSIRFTWIVVYTANPKIAVALTPAKRVFACSRAHDDCASPAAGGVTTLLASIPELAPTSTNANAIFFTLYCFIYTPLDLYTYIVLALLKL